MITIQGNVNVDLMYLGGGVIDVNRAIGILIRREDVRNVNVIRMAVRTRGVTPTQGSASVSLESKGRVVIVAGLDTTDFLPMDAKVSRRLLNLCYKTNE